MQMPDAYNPTFMEPGDKAHLEAEKLYAAGRAAWALRVRRGELEPDFSDFGFWVKLSIGSRGSYAEGR
jgi:hypothetical protein